LTPFELVLARLRLQRLHHRCGRAGADVRHDERLLQALPGLLVEHAEERRLDLAAERLASLCHALAQAAEEAAPRCRGRWGRRGRPVVPACGSSALAPLVLLGSAAVCLVASAGLADDEQIAPVAGHWWRDSSQATSATSGARSGSAGRRRDS